MKRKTPIAGLAIVLSIINAWAEPGGTYILTGKEKGVTEIIKADMAKYPDLYKGETLNVYIAKFKKKNRIGRRKLKPGDALNFPATAMSLKLKSAHPQPGTPVIDESKSIYAKISCKEKLGRFKNNAASCKNADEMFTKVPSKYREARICLLNKKSGDPLEFTVTAPGIVTLVMDKKHVSALKNEGWSAVDEAGRINPGGDIYRILIYEKHLDVGEYSYTKTDPSEAFGIRVLVF